MNFLSLSHINSQRTECHSTTSAQADKVPKMKFEVRVRLAHNNEEMRVANDHELTTMDEGIAILMSESTGKESQFFGQLWAVYPDEFLLYELKLPKE